MDKAQEDKLTIQRGDVIIILEEREWEVSEVKKDGFWAKDEKHQATLPFEIEEVSGCDRKLIVVGAKFTYFEYYRDTRAGQRERCEALIFAPSHSTPAESPQPHPSSAPPPEAERS